MRVIVAAADCTCFDVAEAEAEAEAEADTDRKFDTEHSAANDVSARAAAPPVPSTAGVVIAVHPLDPAAAAALAIAATVARRDGERAVARTRMRRAVSVRAAAGSAARASACPPDGPLSCI
ncbi:hypothetical protein [Burkholderia mallei]|uniref:hypothetical protein n=1 Tax=Burkholderia mallei TaxID=13373 RepID=UPI00057284FB|nr:hypothetical protein [Burkholderia mallei]KYX06438.1 hypothetical protein AS001_10770 [Burkholderia mallei]RJE65311.1 hypothetical protein SA99_05360 [Burkholderia mallei]